MLTRPSRSLRRAAAARLRRAAAPVCRAAPPPQLLARITAGEARLLLLFPVRVAPGPLRPRLFAPPHAAVRQRARAAPWARSPRVKAARAALTWTGGACPWDPPVGLWPGRCGSPRVDLAIVARVFL